MLFLGDRCTFLHIHPSLYNRTSEAMNDQNQIDCNVFDVNVERLETEMPLRTSIKSGNAACQLPLQMIWSDRHIFHSVNLKIVRWKLRDSSCSSSVRWGRKIRNKKKLAPKWHKRSKASQCFSRPWTQWTNETKKLFFPLFRFLLPRASHACSHGSMEKQTREIARKSEERGSLVPAFQFARFVFFLSLFYTRRRHTYRHTHTLKNHSRNVNSTVVFGARPAYTLKYSTCL